MMEDWMDAINDIIMPDDGCALDGYNEIVAWEKELYDE